MKPIQLYIFITLVSVFAACTEPFVPDTSPEAKIVVEGFITAGDNALPPYVFITKSIPFFDSIDLNQFSENFVNDAVVQVTFEDQVYELNPICEVPAAFEEAAEELLGFNPNSTEIEVCIYVDLFQQIPIKINMPYYLDIEVDGEHYTANTTIPRAVELSNFRWDEPPGEANDTLARLFTTIEEPPGPDFYRILISNNDGPFIAPFASVTNDLLFENRAFETPVNNVLEPGEEIDPNTFGLWKVGDSTIIRWMTIDEAHFNFWNTRDFNANSGGPFSSYTRVDGNVDGALGIWGGYHQKDYPLLVEK